ncbi:MAG TPA: ABC transporter permease [Solirubrobacteraceae bacterium]|nr:ABC transporter permease [Solirubrobacteraceae bacterium]
MSAAGGGRALSDGERPVTGAGLARDLSLVGWQVRYEQRSYWRNRGRGVFTFVFPIMFLVIFASLDRGSRISSLGGISYDDFFVPGILAYGVITTTFVNLAMSTAILRDAGVLKRMQGTPLPTWAYMAARIISASLVTLVMTIVVIGLGVAVYGLDLRVGQLPALIVALLLGSATFTAIGIGLTRFIPTADSGPVIVNLLVFPLSFISNIWFPPTSLPSVLRTIAGIFPMRPLASALQYVFDPRHAHVSLFDGPALRTLAIWLAIGVYLMARFLRQPQGEVA